MAALFRPSTNFHNDTRCVLHNPNQPITDQPSLVASLTLSCFERGTTTKGLQQVPSRQQPFSHYSEIKILGRLVRSTIVKHSFGKYIGTVFCVACVNYILLEGVPATVVIHSSGGGFG